MLRLQPSLELLMALKTRIVRNGRRERVGFHQMARGMTVAPGLSPIKGVLDHRPAEQRRRKRVSPLELAGRQIESGIVVPVDLARAAQDQPRSMGQVRPLDEEVQ